MLPEVQDAFGTSKAIPVGISGPKDWGSPCADGKERNYCPTDPLGDGTLDTAVEKEVAEPVAGDAGTDTCSRKVTVRAACGTCCGTRDVAVALGNSGGVIGAGTLEPGGVVARAFAAVVLTELCRLGGCCSPC